ncbi:hypothetical protein EW146_g1162 [Bondarzewia mesenterica]|uniref:Xylanolytic transcriptional activator regulatory domain-containing protein n=1 Tax=Bondarzewia mesenterica TaxID=1095465 RepID=A0A4S4M6M5_9AGAM|nr:hypothetical protein EW146_g1162 [Bondarzewia mesenterica]
MAEGESRETTNQDAESPPSVTTATSSSSAITSAFQDSPAFSQPNTSSDSPRPKLKRNRAILLAEAGFPDDLTNRVYQLEDIVTNTFNHLEPAALAGLDAFLQLLQASNAISSPSAILTGPGMIDPNRVTDHAVQVAVAALGQLSQQGQPPKEPEPPAAPFGPIADILHHIRCTPLAASNAQLSDLRSHFPNRKITAFLLKYFFEESSVHWQYRLVLRPCFEHYYNTFSTGPIPPSIEFTALLAIMCATSLQFLPESDDDVARFAEYPQGRHVLKKRLYDFTRSVLLTAATPPISSIERIRALMVFSVYQWNEGNAGESYYANTLAIRMAQTLAMNRDGVTTWHMRPQDAECRRRIWWTLFILDRSHAMEFCRPYIIFEQHSDVAPCLNIDEATVEDVTELVSKPLEEPTDSRTSPYHSPDIYKLSHVSNVLLACEVYIILQSRWARLLGHMWDDCFAITLPTYRVVLDYESQIRKFELDLPAAFRYQSPQVAQARPYLHFQVISFQTDIHIASRTSQVTLGIAIIIDPSNTENEELEDWIAFAQVLLKDLGTYNMIAPAALQHLDVIRRRIEFVLNLTRGNNTVTLNFVEPSLQHIERATRVLSQPQPCMADLLGQEAVTDPYWSTVQPSVFAGQFPGVESLSGPVDPLNLERFLDSCLTMQSKSPLVFSL